MVPSRKMSPSNAVPGEGWSLSSTLSSLFSFQGAATPKEDLLLNSTITLLESFQFSN